MYTQVHINRIWLCDLCLLNPIILIILCQILMQLSLNLFSPPTIINECISNLQLISSITVFTKSPDVVHQLITISEKTY